MKKLLTALLVCLSITAFSQTTAKSIAGKYVGSLSNGSECSLRINLDSGIMNIKYADKSFGMLVDEYEINEAIEQDSSELFFEGGADFQEAKVKLFLNENGELFEADMKIYTVYTPYKTCKNLQKK